uniref:Uncharacterized protein n=1 Tax=viral metagenome TaxID=1070528 RepID=A0A6C0KNF8_9ZZZZ
MLKITATNIPRDILVEAKIHTPPNRLSPAHTEKMTKNT